MTNIEQEKIQYLDHLSFSSLKLFIQCPRRFFGEKLYRDFKKSYNIEVIIGSGVHKGLELFFNCIKEGKKIEDISYTELRESIFCEIRERELEANKNNIFFSEEEISYVKKIAFELLFRNLHSLLLLIGEKSVIFGSELELRVPIENFSQYEFECHIDLVTQVENIFSIWDWKTVKKVWDPYKKQNLEEYTSQLLLYKYYFHKVYFIPPENVKTFYVFFEKNNYILDKWMSNYTVSQLNTMLSYIQNACIALEEKKFPAIRENRKYKCRFCPFKEENNLCKLEYLNTEQYIRDNYFFLKKI